MSLFANLPIFLYQETIQVIDFINYQFYIWSFYSCRRDANIAGLMQQIRLFQYFPVFRIK